MFLADKHLLNNKGIYESFQIFHEKGESEKSFPKNQE